MKRILYAIYVDDLDGNRRWLSFNGGEVEWGEWATEFYTFSQAAAHQAALGLDRGADADRFGIERLTLEAVDDA